MHVQKKYTFNIPLLMLITFPLLFSFYACSGQKSEYTTFADYPGFREVYDKKCPDTIPSPAISDRDRRLLERFSPRFNLPPENYYPVDFYREYLPSTVLRHYPDKRVVADRVTFEVLKRYQHNKQFYLDFRLRHFQKAVLERRAAERQQHHGIEKRETTVYGRIYREQVSSTCLSRGNCTRDLTFLKYNIVFPVSGLPAKLPAGYETLLKALGLNPDDWHELDNFVAVHIVLDEGENPIAVLLNQHEYSRTYMTGGDIPLPPDERIVFDIAVRSNEVYPASAAEKPVEHRVIKDIFHLPYLLSGDDPPLVRGHDITRGINSGGYEVPYQLVFLSPCDPFYRASIVLGELRPFLGKYIGRDGPNGADYYTIPQLLPLGKLLQFSYLTEGAPEDIRVVEQSIDRKRKTINIQQILEYGGLKLFRDLESLQGKND
jgi:hypothetical protein